MKLLVLSESIQKLETEQCTNVDELKGRLNIVHDLMDFDLSMSLSASFSYAERFMARKLQRHLIQTELLIPRNMEVSYFMKYGQCDLQYITIEDGTRLELLKDYHVRGNRIVFMPRNQECKVTVQYNCGFCIQRCKDQVPSDVIIGILMYAGALHQVKTNVTSEYLKRAVICSEDLFNPYRLKPKA
ncbi:hypothetical protein PVL96_00295 [Aeromonas hydrophila]|uniref:hypothetical protein n=1 Tax=Aeromonas hydrophila TaxID=644 RepID=UPI00237907FA|nr:hypothetical protein [Aeromonas hydrophila]MDD9223473.1 hypothetical protein [Aeromonas hydrophila]